MPQALTRINRDATLVIAPDSGPTRQPALALLAAQVIADSARLDAEFGGLFVELVGGNPRPAAAVYLSLSGANAKQAAFEGLLALVLLPAERDVLLAILSQARRVARLRNPIAHWVWGHSPQIPDSVVLVNPVDLISFKLDLADMTSDIARRLQKDRYSVATAPYPPDPLRENARVYFAHDFTKLSTDIQRVIELVIGFRSVMFWSDSNRNSLSRIAFDQSPIDHLPASDLYAQALDRLTSEPEIHEFLSRQRRNQRIPPEASTRLQNELSNDEP